MRKRPICRTVVVLSFLAWSGAADSTGWHVDGSVTSSGDGASWETAFKRIQQGIDAASDGDTLIVAQGTYTENIHFGGKNIVLRSTNPADPAVVENTTIMAPKDGGSVVSFAGTENETCVLSGFTICDGNAHTGGGINGGTSESRTHATIRNNRIIGNSARVYGGAIAYCDGVIEHNAITDNDGYEGGGLYRCDGPITDNTISRNTAGFPGGGLHECGGLIANNTITDNSADQGGGLADCPGTIEGNLIARNDASSAAGWWDAVARSATMQSQGTLARRRVGAYWAVTARSSATSLPATPRTWVVACWDAAARF